MSNFVVAALWFSGGATFLAGISGFVDTRKVDRRFKTGYRNNEPDARNFGRAAKRTIAGAAICLIAVAVTGMTSPTRRAQSDDTPAATDAVPGIDASASSTDAGASSPVLAATAQQNEALPASGAVLNPNERIVIQGNAPSQQSDALSTNGPASADEVTALSPVNCTDDGTYLGANICKNDTLADGYGRVLREYEAAQGRVGGNDLGLRVEQENWFEKVTHQCSDMDCLTQAFDSRIAELTLRYRKSDGRQS